MSRCINVALGRKPDKHTRKREHFNTQQKLGTETYGNLFLRRNILDEEMRCRADEVTGSSQVGDSSGQEGREGWNVPGLWK